MKQRVTLREIADKAGVHYTTVSRALRNHPALTKETRANLQALAREMGYSPDPMVSALNAYRIAQKPTVSNHGAIAWLCGYPNLHSMQEVDVHRRLYESAEDKALELGYHLQNFWPKEQAGQPSANLERVLRARGIRNLLVASQHHRMFRLKLDWDRYSVVSVSFTFSTPSLDYVAHDHHTNMILIMQQLCRLGYRRVALLLDDYMMTISDHRWLSGFLIGKELLDSVHWIKPPAILNAHDASEKLKAWYQETRPDAFITDADCWQNKIAPALGLKCPQDVGVALISVGSTSFYSGIVENGEAIGAAAVEQLVFMDQHDKRGMTSAPRRILIPGAWHAGLSLRPQA